MERLSFKEVRSFKGIWTSIGQLSVLVNQGDNLTTKFEPHMARKLRDVFTRRQGVAELLCNFVAFDDIFIDGFALDRSGIARELFHALGPLARRCKIVEIPDDIYRAAMADVEDYVRAEGSPEHLEKLFPKFAEISEFFSGNEKHNADHFKEIRNIGPISPRFVDSQGSVERALLYVNIQRESGAPARMSPTHLEVLKRYRGALPVSILEVINRPNALEVVRDNVEQAISQALDVPVPPIFQMLIETIARSKQPMSIVDAVIAVRDEWQAVCFREYIWEMSEALAFRDVVKMINLKNTLAQHIERLTVRGDASSRWTGKLNVAFTPLSLFAIEGGIPIPRHNKHDYVGFVGSWIGPHAV